MATGSATQQYFEGILLKRARGLHRKGALKWQERYCRLTNVSLDYYDPKKMNEPKGQFKVEQMKIIETVKSSIFEKLKGNPFQVGDNSEVMYFATKTPQDRTKWMDSLKKAASDKGVKPLTKYHTGVYSLTSKDRWSCCGNGFRESEGCTSTTSESERLRSQTSPINLDSTAPSLLSPPKDELSSSMTSTASDTTLTEDKDIHPMIRTYTVSGEPMRKPLSKQKRLEISKSVVNPTTGADNMTRTPTTPIPPITEEPTNNGDIKNPKTILPPQLDDLGRTSGASSPAPSIDSGKGVSRPSSMVNGENDPAPLTPQSTRSQATTDSDQTKSIGGGSDTADLNVRRRGHDNQSIMSDASGYASGTLPLYLRKRNRPQSVAYKDGVAYEMPVNINEPTAIDSALNKLHQACKDGNLNVVREEIDTGASVSETEIFNGVPLLPLFISFLHDHRHIMIYLLQQQTTSTIDPNALDVTTRSCLLHWACQRGCLATVRILVHFKADVNMRNHEGNTPLCEASRYGHAKLVKALLDSGAVVNFEGSQNHTPLHYASEAGHEDIVRLLIEQGADPLKKNAKRQSPYYLAFTNSRQEVMDILAKALPQDFCPYSSRGSYQLESEQIVTSLDFVSSEEETRLVAGSRDCLARVFSVNDTLTLVNSLQLANTVLSVSSHDPYIALGSAFIQVADVVTESGWRRTVADDTHDDESLENPPLHLVTFTSDGLLVSAGVESNLVKIWPSISNQTIISQPQLVFNLNNEKKDEKGCIYRLVTSPAPGSPWIGAVVQPGQLQRPSGNKNVYIYNLKEEKIYHIIDSGHGGVWVGVQIAFTHDGDNFFIACKDKLTKWGTVSGDTVLSSTQEADITCVAVSPDGRHVAIGLVSGDTHILNSESGALVFPLRFQKDRSAVSSLSYSKCGSYFATGHISGSVQLWKVADSKK